MACIPGNAGDLGWRRVSQKHFTKASPTSTHPEPRIAIDSPNKAASKRLWLILWSILQKTSGRTFSLWEIHIAQHITHFRLCDEIDQYWFWIFRFINCLFAADKTAIISWRTISYILWEAARDIQVKALEFIPCLAKICVDILTQALSETPLNRQNLVPSLSLNKWPNLPLNAWDQSNIPRRAAIVSTSKINWALWFSPKRSNIPSSTSKEKYCQQL